MQHINRSSATIAATTSTARTAYPAPAGARGVKVYNSGTVPVFLKSGDSSVNAATTDGFLGAGETKVFERAAADTHLAAITASGSAAVYFMNSSPIDE